MTTSTIDTVRRSIEISPPSGCENAAEVEYIVEDSAHRHQWTMTDFTEAVDKYIARGTEQATFICRAWHDASGIDEGELGERAMEQRESIYDPGIGAWGEWQ